MTDYENLMKRCQRGATNLNDANNLLAECYGMLGKVKEIVRIQAENEALRKDAERYRWLRGNHIFAHVQVEQSDGTQPYVYDSELDRSIDEIMSAMGKEG